jgi:outer membrane protein TolC
MAAFAACAVRPEHEDAERDLAARAGSAYARPFAERELPELAADAPLAVWIAHAEAAHGGLEAAWHRWIAALEQVPQDSTQATTAMVGLEHTFDGGSALDRTAISLASEAMNNIVWPGRLGSQGEAALQRARVAAAEYDRERLRLQREVAEAYHELALWDEELRLLDQLRTVVAANVPSVAARARAGAAPQSELLAAEVGLARIDAELARLRGGRDGLAAALCARAGTWPERFAPRPALAPLAALRGDEIAAVDRSIAANPELELRRRELAAARAEVGIREWQWTPGFSLSGLAMGDGATTLGGMLSLPFLRGTAIEASIRQAEAEVRAADALRRQAGNDAAAMVLAELATLRAVEVEAAVLERELLPRLRQAAQVARASWSAGREQLAAWAGALGDAIEVERGLARLRKEHAVGRARIQEAVGGLAGGV